MGDFETLLAFFTILILGIIIYNIINSFLFRNLLRRFGIFKSSRKDFYECGFKPQRKEVIKLPIQFLLIAVFFLLYDIELIFLFPYVSGLLEIGLFDLSLIYLFFLLFAASIGVDYDRHALYWQY